MNALLALSATHLAWLTDCPLTANMAYEHRGTALKGLHEAIGKFSRQNSDAVLAASLLLSWQATEWYVRFLHLTSNLANNVLGVDGLNSCMELPPYVENDFLLVGICTN